jgi:hypothetical protein
MVEGTDRREVERLADGLCAIAARELGTAAP